MRPSLDDDLQEVKVKDITGRAREIFFHPANLHNSGEMLPNACHLLPQLLDIPQYLPDRKLHTGQVPTHHLSHPNKCFQWTWAMPYLKIHPNIIFPWSIRVSTSRIPTGGSPNIHLTSSTSNSHRATEKFSSSYRFDTYTMFRF